MRLCQFHYKRVTHGANWIRKLSHNINQCVRVCELVSVCVHICIGVDCVSVTIIPSLSFIHINMRISDFAKWRFYTFLLTISDTLLRSILSIIFFRAFLSLFSRIHLPFLFLWNNWKNRKYSLFSSIVCVSFLMNKFMRVYLNSELIKIQANEI